MLTVLRFKPQGLTIQEEEHRPESEKLTESGQASIYSDIGDSTLCQIKNIDLDGSFGTKIDTLARHILWIRQHDPGAKSIVFSQYKDFLVVLARAFTQFRICFTGIDRKGGTERFKNDPGVSDFHIPSSGPRPVQQIVRTKSASGRMFSPSCQSTLLRPQPGHRNTCMLVRAAYQHGHRAPSYFKSASHRPIPAHHGLDVPSERNG